MLKLRVKALWSINLCGFKVVSTIQIVVAWKLASKAQTVKDGQFQFYIRTGQLRTKLIMFLIINNALTLSIFLSK